jgi:hypothetical protein
MVMFKYLESGKVKHHLESELDRSAACGRTDWWYAEWKTNEEELKKRSVCKKCEALLNGTNFEKQK